MLRTAGGAIFFTYRFCFYIFIYRDVRYLFNYVGVMRDKKQGSFAKEFLDEAARKGTVKSLAGAVGMPDKEDWRNICNIISIYRKESVKRFGFDILVDCIATARKEYQAGGRDYSKGKFNLVNKDSSMRYHFELPDSFVRVIERAYPLMFRDKDHYHWFCKNFAELRLSEKY